MENKETKIISTIIENGTTKPLNNKWDKCLDDYNNYLKEYIKHYKKSINGNSLSLSKYPYMKAKSEELQKRLTDAQKKSLLTKKQIKRIAKIQTQIVNSCLS